MSALPTASDGLLARPLPEWSREKLFYIDRYLDILCTAMRSYWRLAYADLLAGPGMCADPADLVEQSGSALLAVRRPQFQRLFLNDIDPSAVAALRSRVAGEPASRVRVTQLDCNIAVSDARDFMFPDAGRSRTLGLAVIDPTAFQMSFESIERLTHDVKMDLIIVVMTGYIRRFISTAEYQRALDRFFGTSEWRNLVDERNAGEPITYRRLLDLYEQQLATLGYKHVNDDARMLNSKGSTIYHLVFASKHPRGADFFDKISRRTYSGQRRFRLEEEPPSFDAGAALAKSNG